MSRWEKIVYRDFYDIPRMFIVRYSKKLWLFECRFDDALDDYEENYKVYLLPEVAERCIEGSWENLSKQAIRLVADIPVEEVIFDPSRRKEISTDLLSNLEEKLHRGG